MTKLIILGVLLSAPFLFNNYVNDLYSSYSPLDLTGESFYYESTIPSHLSPKKL